MKTISFIFVSCLILIWSAELKSQSLNLSMSSQQNTVCDGFGCDYDGPTILINEIMLTPVPYDGSIYGCHPNLDYNTMCEGEWIELFNPDQCQWIDISCYYLGNAAADGGWSTYPGGFVLPEGTLVPPLGFVIVRGHRAPPVPTHLLLENGGNTVEIIVNDPSRICIGSGNRLWFPNAGGWFAFYDSEGNVQDAISWNSAANVGNNSCNPGPIGACGFSGSLGNYNDIPDDRKTYITNQTPPENLTFRRIPDGGDWAYNDAASPTYGTCNDDCIPLPEVTCNGQATVNVTGGTPPYSYLWDDGEAQMTQTAVGLCAGEYSVTVTDANNTTATASVTVEMFSPDFSASTSTPEVCVGENISLSSTVSGGQAPYTFEWEGPGGFNSSTQNPDISNAQTTYAGTYTVTVTDDNECVAEHVVEIAVNPNPQPQANNTGPYCVGETAQLNTGTYVSYSWTGPQGFSSSSQNPQIQNIQQNQAGTYTVQVTDDNGCVGTGETNITMHPSPVLSASNTGPYCQGESISLSSQPAGITYQWTGPSGYSSTSQNPTITNSQPNMTGEYVVVGTNSHGCTGTASTNVVVDQDVDATITPPDDVCLNDMSVALTAATSGGTWSGQGVAQSSFNPSNAGIGTHTIQYQITSGACSDSDQTTITVYDNVYVQNVNYNECNDTYTEYLVTFEVVDSDGNPIGFFADSGNGPQEYFGEYSAWVESTEPYHITINDLNMACNEYVLQGVTDCGCLTYSGTMSSLQTLQLCYDQCTDEVSHNGNQVLDGDDAFQFILHDGSHPVNIIARNNTPVFCFTDYPGLVLGQTYYISAIAGNDTGNGDVDLNDPCYSQSQGTPIVWYDIPIPHINTSPFSDCGTEASLSAEPPLPGMSGFWSCSQNFYAINGTTIYSPDIDVLVTQHGMHEFTWTVHNGVCSSSASVNVEFLPTPNAYAGENFSTCGYSADMEAVFSLEGTNGQWSGPGTFSPTTSPDATVSVTQSGQHTFTWRESLGACFDEDQVTVTFIPEPSPSIIPAIDTVCGIMHQLNVLNVQGSGSWTAFANGQQINPNYINGSNNPNTGVLIPNYPGNYREVEFIWTETMQAMGLQCTGSASQTVFFAREPVASVGPNDEAEICGNCFTFNADTTGSGWADHYWLNTTIITSFDDVNIPNATVCIDSLGSFGDSAHVRAPFIWIANNMGCTSIDTMWVTFYKKPKPFAGFFANVCDRDYELNAVYSIPETDSYNPSGIWTVHERPDPVASANISPANQAVTDVTVSHYGQWQFLWRENNSFLTSCYATDTVTIEFVEIPIISAGEDKHVCGPCTELEATTAEYYSGSWVDNGAQFDDFSDPHTGTCVSTYGDRNYIWMVSNFSSDYELACTSIDTVKITYWRIPTPIILTDAADSTTCGLTFNNLRAQQPGTGITGYWWNITDPDPVYGDPNSHNTHVTVTTYGYHDFYWIAANGPTFQPDFCLDTAGPLTIHFIEIPNADAGGDTLFCGYSGSLSANPSVGTGVWSTPSSQLITFDNPNDPNSGINSQVLTGSANPYFNIIWTEDNTNGCTDRDTIKVRFARIPSSEINIVPPKCFGEPATISAKEDSLQHYSWNFYSGIIDSIAPENNQGGLYEYFVYWTNQDTAHNVSLIATNYWGCQSLITMDTVLEPPVPDFGVVIVNDTCLLGKGGIIFEDTLATNAFYWLDSTVGPAPGTPITAVYNLPAGEYPIRARYRTVNQQWYNYYIQTFGNANCTDTIYYEIEPIGLMEAIFEVPHHVFLEDLVAPEAEVTFNNLSDYASVRRRCIWHFGDGNTLTSCDEQVEHIYTEAGCYEPFLIIMNRDLQECRDTAFIDVCIQIDNASKLEIPNIFTPNGDGINDFFQVKAETLKTFNGHIVNRWGKVVYSWTNWQDEEAGWDGKLSGGTKATSGVYYYVIKAIGMDDVEYEERGALHLMR